MSTSCKNHVEQIKFHQNKLKSLVNILRLMGKESDSKELASIKEVLKIDVKLSELVEKE